MTDTPLSRSIRSVRQTIWSSALYRRTRRIAADLTRPVRCIELALIFRQDLTLPINVSDADVKIEIEQASSEDVEQAASLHPVGSRLEIFLMASRKRVWVFYRARRFRAGGLQLAAASPRSRRWRHDLPSRPRSLSL